MRNNFEKDIYRQLAKQYGKDNVSYEAVKIPYHITGYYCPDFLIDRPDDPEAQFFIESKGRFRKEDMRKLRAVKDYNPELDLRIIFYNDKKYCKTMNYSNWAEKYGFPYSIGTVPKDW